MRRNGDEQFFIVISLSLLLLIRPIVLGAEDKDNTSLILHNNIFRIGRKIASETDSMPIVANMSVIGMEASTRYGLKIEECPNGDRPQLTSGIIKWCKVDDECQISYECTLIIGMSHFGVPVRYCCPTRATACTKNPFPQRNAMAVLTAVCREDEPPASFYYFDMKRLKCVRKRQSCGVKQNDNGGDHNDKNYFLSMEECRTKCESAGCKLGESVLLRKDADEPLLCQTLDDCPVGYNCREDRLFRRKVCCGYDDFEPCPLNFTPFIVPFTGRARTCTKNALRDDCPHTYVCVKNDVDRKHYCCAQSQGICPHGHHPYYHPMTDRTIKCNPIIFDAVCPPGYMCSSSVGESTWGFCCSRAVTASCPDDASALINHFTNEPQTCAVGSAELCGTKHFCYQEFVDGGMAGICCSKSRWIDTAASRKVLIRNRQKPDPPNASISGETPIDPSLPSESERSAEDIVPPAFPSTSTGINVVLPPPDDSRSAEIIEEERSERGEQEVKEEVDESKREKTTINAPLVDVTGGAEIKIEIDEKNKELNGYESATEHELYELENKIEEMIAKKKSKKAKKTRNKPGGEGEESAEKEGESDEQEGATECQTRKKSTNSKKPPRKKGVKMVRRRRGRLRCPRHYKPVTFPNTNFILHCTRRRRTPDGGDTEEEDEDQANCPGSSLCMNAVGDRLRRSICCISVTDEQDGAVRRSKATSPRTRQRPAKEVTAEAEEEDEEEAEKEDSSSAPSVDDERDRDRSTEIVRERGGVRYVTVPKMPMNVINSRDSACPTAMPDRACIPRLMDTCIEDGFYCHFNRELKNFMCCSLRRARRIIG